MKRITTGLLAVIELAGIGMIMHGAWLVNEATGWIVTGAGLVLVAVAGDR